MTNDKKNKTVNKNKKGAKKNVTASHKKTVKKVTKKDVKKEPKKAEKKEVKEVVKEEPKKEINTKLTSQEKKAYLAESKLSQVEKSTISKMLKTILIVLVMLVVGYFLINLINGNYKNKDKVKSKIQDLEILASSTFNQFDPLYYVVFYDKSAKENSYIIKLVNKYKNSKYNIYEVDIDNNFNKKYRGKENITNDITKFKVEQTTFLEIKDKKIVSYTVGRERVKERLDTIVKAK